MLSSQVLSYNVLNCLFCTHLSHCGLHPSDTWKHLHHFHRCHLMKVYIFNFGNFSMLGHSSLQPSAVSPLVSDSSPLWQQPLHYFLGWEVLPVNETYWKDLHRNILQNELLQESFFRHPMMWLSSLMLACVRKVFFFWRNWICNLFTKKHPTVLGDVYCAWLWKESHGCSQTIPWLLLQHRGVRDQRRENCASAPAHSLRRMKSTAENSLPSAV